MPHCTEQAGLSACQVKHTTKIGKSNNLLCSFSFLSSFFFFWWFCLHDCFCRLICCRWTTTTSCWHWPIGQSKLNSNPREYSECLTERFTGRLGTLRLIRFELFKLRLYACVCVCMPSESPATYGLSVSDCAHTPNCYTFAHLNHTHKQFFPFLRITPVTLLRLLLHT